MHCFRIYILFRAAFSHHHTRVTSNKIKSKDTRRGLFIVESNKKMLENVRFFSRKFISPFINPVEAVSMYI